VSEDNFAADRRIVIAAIEELRELRGEFSERGLNPRGLSAEIVRLAGRLNDLERRREQ
jgi:hypothetical protein